MCKQVEDSQRKNMSNWVWWDWNLDAMPGQTSTLKKLFWNVWQKGVHFSNAQSDNIAREVDARIINFVGEYYSKVEGAI